jgi:uncharacterized iron-regulated protein
MSLMTLLAVGAALSQDAIDPYMLPIGPQGTIVPQAGFTSTSTGKSVSADDIAAAAKGVSFVMIGENHGTPSHHQAQADIIRALVRQGRHVVVGMEMFTRPNQLNVNGLGFGGETIEQFEVTSDWKGQWGHNFAAYRPVLQAIKDEKLPVVALNVPREWIRQASRQGYESFNDIQKKWVPELYLGNKEHEMVVSALLGGHPLQGSGSNMLAGQVTWDTGMAQTALEWVKGREKSKWVMVVIAGSGHVMYDQGINYRIQRMSGMNSLNVVCIQEAPSGRVTRGIAEYVFLGK